MNVHIHVIKVKGPISLRVRDSSHRTKIILKDILNGSPVNGIPFNKTRSVDLVVVLRQSEGSTGIKGEEEKPSM